jgi:2'-5' RNA ligase
MRQFLALELPLPMHRSVVRALEQLARTLQGWRWVRPEGVHLTLRFLGEVPAERDGPGRALWRGAAEAARPFRLRLGPLGCFPGSGVPRVLWVGIEEVEPGGALVELAQDIERSARVAGYPPEPRAFHPHLTLARAERGRRPSRPGRDAEPGAADGWFRELVLFESRLAPAGARYTALERFALVGSGEGRARQ